MYAILEVTKNVFLLVYPSNSSVNCNSMELLKYVNAMHDRVTVIFSTMFKDPDDMMIGKVFMQEFTESQRRLDRAPQVLYSHRIPPSELQGTGAAVNDSLAYITFVLYPRHVTPGPNREKTINLIHMLRNYLHYHIKCSKAYLHMRMRAKTVEFLKVLNRAHRDTATSSLITIAPVGETPTATDSSKSESARGDRVFRTG
ncbi:Arp2/3 complex 34 kDa subunit [Fasciola gigantica]|uniref:Arp2/3 complex 34 kDa subunit n=1 Tax=Fasciola gigantica TaxID=46835 RepID=A0A504ZE28_FASGI|nr:Arp2/3 complex 34 kDa subunit [Fasciola gigantica]